jgi:iron complex outermembrane receptor protein
LQARPAIDVARHGINQGTVVVRGFNNAFSGATLTLVDNRIARVPSLRYNAMTMIPTTNEDYERVEVVSGPGSALYGPNAANGVVHFLTKSPLKYQGTSLNVAGGNRDLWLVSGRHAMLAGDRAAFKVTGQYFEGTDFEYVDPVEADNRQRLIDAGQDPGLIGVRDFNVKRWAFEGRLDVQVGDESELAVSGGYNEIDNIELTGLGAAQAQQWGYGYGQARLVWKKLFVQTYMNTSNAGDTYLLRTGNLIVDKSKFIVGQVQHAWEMSPRQSFTYGVDGLFTRPDTEGTINGRNEDDDNIDEFGGYVQSDTQLHDRWDLVLAARLDDHSQLRDPVFSPRAALQFAATDDQTVRATYNRAFSTPSTNNLFLDLVVLEDLGGLGAPTGLRGYDVFTQGVPKDGFSFRRDTDGGVDGLYMEVPEAFQHLVDPMKASQLPADATQMWGEALMIAVAGGADPGILGIPAPPPGLVGSSLRALNPTTGSFVDISPSEVQDIAPLKPTITNTAELGWKGKIGGSFSAAADIYYTRIQDFVGPLRVETPNVFFDRGELEDYLGNFLPPGADSVLAAGLAAIPLGTVTPTNSSDQAALIVTYRNFGDIDLGGVDLGFDWSLDRRWTVGVSYSWVSEDFFEDVEGELDVSLNAPKNKAGIRVRYDDRNRGLRVGAAYRYVDAFPVESGVFNGRLDHYNVVDVTAAYDLPFAPGASIALSMQNAFDEPHREFIGAPTLRRLTMGRISYNF